MSKSILIICRSAPYSSSAARDALDMALAGAVFEQSVSFLLLDDAVLQLLPDQRSSAIQAKNPNAMLNALPMYDIEHIYTSFGSLALHGLDANVLTPAPKVLDAEELKHFIARHEVVLTL